MERPSHAHPARCHCSKFGRSLRNAVHQPNLRKPNCCWSARILTPGQRTVAAALRVMGRSGHRDYARYHEVLNRAVLVLPRGSPRPAGAAAPAPGWWRRPLDLRHRRNPGTASGRQRSARAIYRDPVQFQPPSTGQSQRVALDLPDVAGPNLGRTPWALPVHHRAGHALDAVRTSSRDAATRNSPAARQMVMQLRRWLPQRPLVLVGDNSYAVLDLLHAAYLRQPVALIARLRLDAALYAPAPKPGSEWPASPGPAAATTDKPSLITRT